MTQVRLWTIVGEPQCGKSRTVRDLASLPAAGGQPSFKDVLLRGGGFLQVYAKRMAWQENRKTPAESVAEIKAKIGAMHKTLGRPPFAVNVLSTLRFDGITHSGPTKVCPDADDYLEAWIAEGWSLESLVLMSPDRMGAHDYFSGFGAPTTWVYDSRDMEIGQMTGAVRNHFGWA